MAPALKGSHPFRQRGINPGGSSAMIGVIDASALIRLFIPDGPLPRGMEVFFQEIDQGKHIALAPELLVAETANVLLKKQKQGELTDHEVKAILDDILAMPIRLMPHSPLAPAALDIALRHHLTVYDALYIAVAMEQGAVVFTADESVKKTAAALHLQVFS
jgi:predicted nucleic acid-binding protein